MVKGFRIMFIFNLNVQDFPESNLLTADQVGKKRFSVELISQAWFFWNPAGAVLSGLRTTLEPPPWKWQSGEELLLGSRSTLEQTALREILLMRGILG
jgi:hypothetical protein